MEEKGLETVECGAATERGTEEKTSLHGSEDLSPPSYQQYFLHTIPPIMASTSAAAADSSAPQAEVLTSSD